MQIVIDKQGNPALIDDGKDEFVTTFVPGQEKGNPYRSAGGKFGYAPAGVKIILGKEILPTLSPQTRRELFARAQALKANQLSLRIINDTIHFVLLRDGRRLNDFRAPREQKNSPQQQARQEKTAVENFFNDRDARENDAIIEFARELDLDNTNVREQMEKRLKHDLSDEEAAQLAKLIRDQRIADLIDYLWTNYRRKVLGISSDRRVRIQTPRGYLRRSFARLSEEDAKEIMDRLQAKGLTESQIQDAFVGRLPKRLREGLENVAKIKEPDKETGHTPGSN